MRHNLPEINSKQKDTPLVLSCTINFFFFDIYVFSNVLESWSGCNSVIEKSCIGVGGWDKLMNPPVVLADQLSCEPMRRRLGWLPVVLADQGSCEPMRRRLGCQFSHELGPVTPRQKNSRVMRHDLDHGYTTQWKAQFHLKHQFGRRRLYFEISQTNSWHEYFDKGRATHILPNDI